MISGVTIELNLNQSAVNPLLNSRTSLNCCLTSCDC